MSYSCLNMDDLNDQIDLETVNLCLEEENAVLTNEDIPGVVKLNDFLISFDNFRGNYYQGVISGYYIPLYEANILNSDLYNNLVGTLDFAPEMVNLYNFFDEQYETTISFISTFSQLDTETYVLAKELIYNIETLYYPNILSLEGKDPVGPKGVYRKSIEDCEDITEIFLDSVDSISVGMYVRGPKELDNDGDHPITDPLDLPTVIEIFPATSSVTVSLPTNTTKDGLFLFGFPEFLSFNQRGTGEYPEDSLIYISNDDNTGMLDTLNSLVEYLIEYKSGDFKTIEYEATVSNNKFYLDTTDEGTEEAPEETMVEGITYRFDQTDPSNLGRPFQFSTTPDGIWDGGVVYTDNVTVVGTPGFSTEAYVEIKITSTTPDTLYYFSSNFEDMGNKLDIIKN